MATVEDIVYGLISLVIASGIFFIIRSIIKIKLKTLQGTQKMLGLITLGIVGGELIYLGLNFDLFRIATEIIASLGVAFALIVFALQNNLKNAIAGIGIYLNPQIDIGDIIEIDGNKGVIIELELTKITCLTEEGVKMFIPAQILLEEVTRIYPRSRK